MGVFTLYSVVLLAVAAYLYSSLPPQSRFDGCCPVHSWEGRHAFTAGTVVRPGTLEDIVAAVDLARRDGKRISIVGAGHSYADIAVADTVANSTSGQQQQQQQRVSGSIQVCMRCYSGLLNVDTEKSTVTVRAGTSLQELIHILDEYKLALDVIPTVFEPTIGGIIAAGSHGCGSAYSSVSTQVLEIELVTPDGKVNTLSLSENTELFYAATVGLGAMGIVTKVTLQVGPKFNVEEQTSVLHWSDVRDNFQRVMTDSHYVKILVEYQTGMVMVVSGNRTQRAPEHQADVAYDNFMSDVIEFFQLSTSYLPSLIPAAMHFIIHWLGVFQSGQRVDEWHKVLSIHQRIPLHLESEYAVRFDATPEAVDAVFQVVKETGVGVSVFNEIRCATGDKFWLSNGYGSSRCHVTLGLYNKNLETEKKYFGLIGERLLALGAEPRPHWAKFYTMDESTLTKVYPRWNDFVAMKRKLDPNGMFCNGYLRRVFSESKVCH